MRRVSANKRGNAAASSVLRGLETARAVATLPMVLGYRVSNQQDLIDGDVARWLAVIGAEGDGHGLHSLLYAFREFRSLYYWRLSCGNALGALAAHLLRSVWKPVAGLSLATRDIGPGLFIAHGEGTTLAGERIGANCYVHQGVTIGWDYKSLRTPVVGDDVFIGAGAVIVGDLTVGDGARIGANALVLCDVPAGATAVGVPARVLVGRRDLEPLKFDASKLVADVPRSARRLAGAPIEDLG